MLLFLLKKLQVRGDIVIEGWGGRRRRRRIETKMKK
jgi:hypothetical protein